MQINYRLEIIAKLHLRKYRRHKKNMHYFVIGIMVMKFDERLETVIKQCVDNSCNMKIIDNIRNPIEYL